MSLLPICRNCKYFRPDREWIYSDKQFHYGRCAHHTSQTIDLVSGIPTYELARTMRDKDNLKCGKTGAFHTDANLWQLYTSYMKFDVVAYVYAYIYIVLIVILVLIHYKT